MPEFNEEELEEIDFMIEEYGAEEYLKMVAEVFKRREDLEAATALLKLTE